MSPNIWTLLLYLTIQRCGYCVEIKWLRFVMCRKDVRLPVQLQRAMAAEAEATREAKAKVIIVK